MGYYVRLLTPSNEILPFNELREALELNAQLSLEGGADDAWEQVLLSLDDGRDVLVVERNPVEGADSLGSEEIQEFLEDIAECNPQTAVEWLNEYLPTVKSIYAFQLLNACSSEEGGAAFDTLRTHLWSSLGGIFQADAEGFSNEDGYHILWQFSDNVSGPWNMAVLQNGKWIPFEMDLGNRQQRTAFLAGRVPDDALIV